MNEEKLNEGIKKLKDIGLNLFSSTLVKNLPQDVLDLLDLQSIPYDVNDTLCLIAHGGPALWENLVHPLKEQDHPIDRYSTQHMNWFATNVLEDDIQILFPHDDWTIPLQRIGRFMNLSRPSLLGLDINRDYGVWFAFRGAFLTKKKFPDQIHEDFSSPCETCKEAPCKGACPVHALEGMQQFNLSLCGNHRLKINSSCSDRCLARLSCPYKSEHRYEMGQIRYHMTNNKHLIKLSSFLK
ncbi:MAG: hypothetical protein ACXVLQ_07095 [Bacteriovorax sp.]